jgi:site-specific recombinase XerD
MVLRHSATTLLIANGVDIKAVKEICGHSDIAPTVSKLDMENVKDGI